MNKVAALVGGAVVIGLLAGGLLDVLTFLVARYGPQSGHWSFRGNGALAVPFGLGPVFLGAGWAALVSRYRGSPNWVRHGVVALISGVALIVLSVIFLFLTDVNGMLFIVGWMVVAPLIATFAPRPDQATRPGSLAGHIGAGVAFPVALALGFYASELVLPPGS